MIAPAAELSSAPVDFPAAFGGSFVINLPEREDRLKAFIHQFNTFGWPGPEVFPAFKFEDAGTFPSPGTRGCFHSHLECLHRAQERNLGSVLIFEDDTVIAPDLPRLFPVFKPIMDGLPWDMIFFGHENSGVSAVANESTTHIELQAVRQPFTGAHFYVIRDRILERLIAHLNRVRNGMPGDDDFGPMPLDGAYNTFRKHNTDVRAFIAKPKLGWQRPSRSDITPHWIDQISELQYLVGIARTVKYAAQRIALARNPFRRASK